ncbi:MAG: glycyl-radical enzyme activating protein [Bacteroidetes bacterium]|nr:glycyl-radical enzyme activating protein [Bacteroidota bacterium]
MDKSPLIFDIKKYAINDGPGIRITIFFKGCALSCKWCHNPESIPVEQQKMFSSDKCIGSQECIKHCPNEALTLTSNGIVTNTDICAMCGKCAEVCPTKAIEMTGELMPIEQVMSQIKREVVLMDTSGGGVTISGGEPLLHHKYLIKLLDACGKEGIHRCIDTTGFSSTKVLLEVAAKSEHFLYDLKMMDAEKHKKWTGVSNVKILENLQILAAGGMAMNIRIPLIKGVNDDDDNIYKSAKFIANLKGNQPIVNILPFHNIAAKKYEKLGAYYDKGVMDEPDSKRVNEILEIFTMYSINVRIGG